MRRGSCPWCEGTTAVHWTSLGWMMNKLRAYGSRLEGRPAWVTLWWLSATDCLIRKKKQMRLSSDIGRSLKFTGPGLWAGGLNRTETCWSNKAQETQEYSGVHWWQLPNTGDQGSNERRFSAGPHTYELGRTDYVDMRARGCFDCSEHDMGEFKIWRGRS